MLNSYTWDLYLSSGGQEVVGFFRNNFENGLTKEYSYKIEELHKLYSPTSGISEMVREELLDLYEIISDDYYLLEGETFPIKSDLDYLYNLFKENVELQTDREIFDEFSYSMSYYTSLLTYHLPDHFVPYYFKYNFNFFESICREFGINLSQMPLKSDYKGRFYYYGEVCESLHEFRLKNNLSPYELFAFLYDFAPKYMGGYESYIAEDLPEAKAAYFIGGSPIDKFLSFENDEIIPWQSSPETLVGDNILMYMTSPVSSLDSIWRSVSTGFNDPFFYYYRCTYIGKAKKIKRLPYKEMKDDPVIRNLSIVRKNMQGVNGEEILPSDYNYILDKVESDEKRLEYFVSSDNDELKREKDVEDILVKPLLKELGYSEDDYIRQLYIPIGNKNYALIPDFIINPQITKEHQAADFIIEAKYSISSNKELTDAKIQARSYAKQLYSKYTMIASKEFICLMSEEDDYSHEIIKFTWEELKEEDKFYQLYKMIGKEYLK